MTGRRNSCAGAMLLVVASLWGCSENDAWGGESETPTEVAESSNALWSPSGTGFIPNGQIAVCFSPVRRVVDGLGTTTFPTVAANDPDYLAFRNVAQTLIEETFEGLPETDIDLTGWGTCADRETGTSTNGLRIVVDLSFNNTGYFRHCAPDDISVVENWESGCTGGVGYWANWEQTIFISATANPGLFQRTVLVHEVTHALGFAHEFDRLDSTQTPETCAARTPSPSNQGMTIYDANSITNSTYCFTRATLSQLDLLGLSIAYASTFQEKPVFAAAFAMGDGTFLAMPGTQALQKWIARGAGPAAFLARPGWRWDGGSLLNQDSVVVPAGTHVLSGTYTDFRSRAHTIQANVSGDASKFAAMLGVII